jgi:hypothetical protein
MTTNANKFGLRKAAAERTRKHAQRTPLPPRPGQIEAAREAHAEVQAQKALEQHLGRSKAGGSPTMAVEATDTKSLGKAKAFHEKAVAAKWDVSLELRGDVLELTATRGPETIVQGWRGGVWQYDVSVYAFADRTTKPRNASGAAKLLERAQSEAAAEANKVASNNSFRKREPKDLAPIVLPLDPDLLTDAEAAKFFKGQTVRWYNRLSRSTETAMVSRNSTVRVTRWEGETTVSFCCPVTGFRAFHLSAALAVGRGKIVSTEAAAIELEEVA